MSRLLKRIKKSPPMILLKSKYMRYMGKKSIESLDDYTFVRNRYKKLGRDLDLKTPKRFTEKLQWLKLFWRDEQVPVCTDKFEVREYLTKKGFGYLLNDLIDVYETIDDFDPQKLPDRFVLKGTHGSGWNLIVTDKTKVNWFWWKKIIRDWMKQNLYYLSREWNYENLKPRIVAERYLQDDSGELRDFKIFCMNGEPRFVQIDENRASNHKRKYVDCEGRVLAMQDDREYRGVMTARFSDNQREMIRIARELCTPFPQVRVDFYECDGKIYFGELTFFDGSGFYNFSPDEWDFTIGEMLILPEPNHNLELYRNIMNGM